MEDAHDATTAALARSELGSVKSHRNLSLMWLKHAQGRYSARLLNARCTRTYNRPIQGETIGRLTQIPICAVVVAAPAPVA